MTTQTPVPPAPATAPLFVRLMRLAVALGILWLVVYVAAPFTIEHIAPLKRFSDVAAENDIHPGALYYTDLPVSSEAEVHNRHTIRFVEGQKKHRQTANSRSNGTNSTATNATNSTATNATNSTATNATNRDATNATSIK